MRARRARGAPPERPQPRWRPCSRRVTCRPYSRRAAPPAHRTPVARCWQARAVTPPRSRPWTLRRVSPPREPCAPGDPTRPAIRRTPSSPDDQRGRDRTLQTQLEPVLERAQVLEPCLVSVLVRQVSARMLVQRPAIEQPGLKLRRLGGGLRGRAVKGALARDPRQQ